MKLNSIYLNNYFSCVNILKCSIENSTSNTHFLGRYLFYNIYKLSQDKSSIHSQHYQQALYWNKIPQDSKDIQKLFHVCSMFLLIHTHEIKVLMWFKRKKIFKEHLQTYLLLLINLSKLWILFSFYLYYMLFKRNKKYFLNRLHEWMNNTLL